MKKKKQNIRGGVKCRVWLEKTFAKYDRNSPDLIISDQAIGKMFCLNASSVARIRHELGIPAPRVRYRIASDRLGAKGEVAPVQESIQELTRQRLPERVKEEQRVELLRLKGSMEGFRVWMSEIEKRIGTVANVPTSAKSSEDALSKPTTVAITETVQLPKWCKDWQWVMDGEGAIGQIFDVHRSGHIVIVDYVRENRRGFAEISSLKPVRFRPYSYEEAKGLLGKTMEYTVKNACASVHYSMLICNVSSNDNNGDTFIHSCRFSDWVDCEATIDGVPIGVPEIDYEACRAKTPEE